MSPTSYHCSTPRRYALSFKAQFQVYVVLL
jgi:hypothetical protein